MIDHMLSRAFAPIGVHQVMARSILSDSGMERPRIRHVPWFGPVVFALPCMWHSQLHVAASFKWTQLERKQVKIFGQFLQPCESLEVQAGRRMTAYDSRPMTSEMRWPSFLLASLICPTAFMNCTPSIHSSVVSSTSRAKSWTCRMREERTCFVRGVVLGPIALMTFWVK